MHRVLPLITAFVLLSTSCATIKNGYRTQTGIASWYGRDFHGRPTASGEIYNMYAMTAAHRTLPLGTILRVTNLENRKKVKVTVNDRGPFVKGRIIDLSYGAAKRLGMVEKGTARVRIEVIGRDRKYIRYIRVDDTGDGDYVVQVGAFRDVRNARRLKEVLSWRYSGVYIARATVSGRTFYRVRLGRYPTRADAYRTAQRLASEGYEVMVTRDQ